MAKIKKETIDEILSKARIEDIVGDCIQLKRKGARYIGLCPFHDDKHATNFSVYPPDNCFKCFACDAKGGPVDFIMRYKHYSYPDAIRWIGRRVGVIIDDKELEDNKPKKMNTPELPTLYIDPKFVAARSNIQDDNLVKWLKALPWDGAAHARIDAVLEAYRIGHSKQGLTIFWQIDENFHVRTGKMMLYKTDGHRDKETKYNYDWIHSLLTRSFDENGKAVYRKPWPYPNIYDPDKQEMRQCYFGQHLLKMFPKATVNIVESEKTALIMSISHGDPTHRIWVACGGLGMITQERLEPFIREKRQIMLFPDRDGIQEWKDKTYFIDYPIKVETEMVTNFWKPEDGEKADIADIIIRWVKEGMTSPRRIMQDMLDKSEALKKLNEHFNFNSI